MITEIVEKVTVVNTKSHLWEMIRAGISGGYSEQFKTDEGKQKIWDAYQEELDRVANNAFSKGREYERTRL